MHIPNGFINNSAGAFGMIAAALSVAVVGLSKVFNSITEPVLKPVFAAIDKRMNSGNAGGKRLSQFGSEYLTRLALIVGIIFTAQMFNFPINQGTSGHLLGGVLAGLFLGPWGGMLALTLVLLVQGSFFGDGGMMAIGANIINMAILGTMLPYFLLSLVKNEKIKPLFIIVTGWVSVIIAATACSFELSFFGSFELVPTLKAMLETHAIIGVGEGLISLGLFYLLTKIFGLGLYEKK